jgi:hypothetical protein
LAVFILAIGIISVAAIFPAGIAQQVQTKDAIYGPIVAEQAANTLRSKLSQDDFGTFEQFGLTAGDRHQIFGTLGDRDPEIQSDAHETISGDWGWMRPSFILPDGQPPISPGVTPAKITQPNALDGAIDIFSLRKTRASSTPVFSPLAEQDNEEDGSDFFYTSDYGKISSNNFAGRYPFDITRSTDDSLYPFNQSSIREANVLAGIPFNRARFVILDPPAPFESVAGLGASGDFDYRLDPARAGRLEPLVTFTQGERSWPIGSETPEYYWDCMFRRYQGRIQVAIFVYRVTFGGAGSGTYTVNACSLQGNSNPPSESPLPARIDLPFTYRSANGPEVTIDRWFPNGQDPNDPTDDMVVPGTTTLQGESVLLSLDAYDNGWQAPGQWLLDQNGTVHRVFAGRRSTGEGPVRLGQRVPYISRQASNGNLIDAEGEFTDENTASAVKSIWFIPPESRDGFTLIPVFVAVKDL